MAGITFNFLAQPTHKNVDGTWRDERTFLPHGIKKLIASEHASAMADEILEQPKLADGGLNLLALHTDGHGSNIDFEFAELNQFAERRLLLGPQNVTNARNELAGTEWFGDIAVAPGVEGLQTIHFLGAGGKKDNRRLTELFVLTNLATEVEAVHFRQHDIEEKQRRGEKSGRRNDRCAGEKSGNVESGGAQVMFNEARDVDIVFDDINEIRVTRIVYRLQGVHVPKRKKWLFLEWETDSATLKGPCCWNVALVLKEG